jgi:two-component system NtrC family sensor kinase
MAGAIQEKITRIIRLLRPPDIAQKNGQLFELLIVGGVSLGSAVIGFYFGHNYGAINVVSLLIFGAIVCVLAVVAARIRSREWRAREIENRQRNDEMKKLRETQAQLVKTEKLISIGRLAAGVAHEINNPVGFVTSNSTTLMDYINRIKEILSMHETGVDPALIKRRRKMVKLDFILTDVDSLIMENIEGLSRISNIVSNLKNFAREESSGSQANADINDCLRTVLMIAKNELKYYVDVTKDFGEIGMVPANSNELNQVFLNIILNAAQAIRSLKRPEKGAIALRTWKDENWIYCSIEDDGPGIPEHIQPKIFDPFFTTKDVGEGTGLGLAISYDIIVNKHHGDITVKSETGKGTTFTVRLPRKREHADE